MWLSGRWGEGWVAYCGESLSGEALPLQQNPIEKMKLKLRYTVEIYLPAGRQVLQPA